MFNGYNWQTRVLEVRPDRLGAAIDSDTNVNPSFSVQLMQPGLNHSVLNSLSNFDDVTAPLTANGELLSGGTGMRALFVGNVRLSRHIEQTNCLFPPSFSPAVLLTRFLSYPSISNGRILKIFFVLRVLWHVPTLLLALMAGLEVSAQSLS